MTTTLITIFGGSGFIGRHTVRALARRGYRIRVAVRRPDLAVHLQPLGTVGQIQAVQANLRDRASVEAALKGADAVVNLVGILAESGRQSFEGIQAKGPKLVAEAAAAAGIEAFVQMSAIGANEQSASDYASSKARGEAAVRTAIPGATIVRPSIVFGPEDNFFNQFANLATMLPALPLIGGGHTRFQPVFVGDVADAVARIVAGEAKIRPHLRARRAGGDELPRGTRIHPEDHRPPGACFSTCPSGWLTSMRALWKCCQSRC